MMPIPGSEYEFPDCPMAYLRDGALVRRLRDEGRAAVAEHLIEGAVHPATVVADVVFELESGARNIAQCSPKLRTLAHLYIAERNARDEHRRRQSKQEQVR